MPHLALIQLPDDVVSVGYKQTRPFHHEQVFHSKRVDFTGTEHDFLKAGKAYAYIPVDAHTRLLVTI